MSSLWTLCTMHRGARILGERERCAGDTFNKRRRFDMHDKILWPAAKRIFPRH
jgi:hypothetical protein